MQSGTRRAAGPYPRNAKSSGVAGPQAQHGQRAPHGAPRDAATLYLEVEHETRGALAITHLPVESGAVAPRVPRGAAPDRTGCATVLISPGACPAPAAVEESRRQQDRLRGAFARGHGVSSEEPRREERRVGAFSEGLAGLRARVLDAERCSDSPLCMVAGETGGERPAASSRPRSSAGRAAPVTTGDRVAGSTPAGATFSCVTGGHGDPRRSFYAPTCAGRVPGSTPGLRFIHPHNRGSASKGAVGSTLLLPFFPRAFARRTRRSAADFSFLGVA